MPASLTSVNLNMDQLKMKKRETYYDPVCDMKFNLFPRKYKRNEENLSVWTKVIGVKASRVIKKVVYEHETFIGLKAEIIKFVSPYEFVRFYQLRLY